MYRHLVMYVGVRSAYKNHLPYLLFTLLIALSSEKLGANTLIRDKIVFLQPNYLIFQQNAINTSWNKQLRVCEGGIQIMLAKKRIPPSVRCFVRKNARIYPFPFLWIGVCFELSL